MTAPLRQKSDNAAMSNEKRQLPPWLLGLIIAVVVSLAVLLAIKLLGYGDDPVIGGLGQLGS